MKVKRTVRNPAAMAWYLLGGLVAMGVTMLVMRELPSMRREMRILSM